MVDYEKGTASWDISTILTLHDSTVYPHDAACARVQNLRQTTHLHRDRRLHHALATPCSCGAGDSDAERTSIIKKEREDALRASGATGDAPAEETSTSQP